VMAIAIVLKGSIWEGGGADPTFEVGTEVFVQSEMTSAVGQPRGTCGAFSIPRSSTSHAVRGASLSFSPAGATGMSNRTPPRPTTWPRESNHEGIP
jgi:hypothetical protein